MNKDIILTICIPTYNRCRYVIENVNSLIPQLSLYKDNVELLVCDNASDDGTIEAIIPILEKIENATYFRHDRNIGGINNFFYAISKSNGKYVLLLGDDDILSPYFCTTILQMINQYDDVSMINYNYLRIDNKGENLSLFDNTNYGKGVRCYTGADFIKTFWNKPSFMTSNVFKKTLMEEGISKCRRSDTYGYDWLLCLYYGIRESKCVIHYDFPLVLQCIADNRTIPDWSLFSIVGIGNVFEELDRYIPGCNRGWRKYTRISKKSFYLKIFSANLGKESAKMHIGEYKKHLSKTEFIFLKIAMVLDRYSFYLFKKITIFFLNEK